MSTRLNSILSLVLLAPNLCLAAAPSDDTPVTLGQCYTWARAQSEDLKIRQEDINKSQARARGAIGSALPEVDFRLTDTWQQPSGVERLEAKGFSGFVEKNQLESRFTAQQALFSGLQEFSAEAGFRRERERDRLRLQRAERELFEKTAQAFYAAVGLETERANTAVAFGLSEDRLKELRDFLKLGKARESEVFTAKAHTAALKGELDRIDGNLFSARQELSYLTGQDLSARPLLDEAPLPASAPALDGVLPRARERSDLRAQREDVAARKMRIRYERGAFWPTADLTANYYTKRATFLKDIDWDVILDVDVPILSGGTVSAAVREAKADYHQAQFALQQLERWVEYDVVKTLGELEAAIQEVRSMDAAAQAARQSYDSLRKEYRLGLVTNLDVLQALDFLQAQQSDLDAARLKAKRLLIRLNVATEQLP
jgi:outer membrane protein TolC